MGYEIRKSKPFIDKDFERKFFFSTFFIKFLAFHRREIRVGIPIYTGAGSYI
jgi:hypothetical protein